MCLPHGQQSVWLGESLNSSSTELSNLTGLSTPIPPCVLQLQQFLQLNAKRANHKEGNLWRGGERGGD